MRLLLIDAYSQIYRAFFAFSKMPRINSKGENTSAVFGFVNTMEDVIRRLNPTHVALVFDPVGPTFRHEEYELYKANRDASPEEIHAAVPIIKEIAAAYHFPAIVVDGYEADDVVGTLAYKAQAEGFEVFMLTPDKDYGQLVKENVYIYRPRSFGGGYEQLGVEEVKAKWGIENPQQVRDILGLMGDKSDNIPGCNGIGEKNAIKLINQFGSIENMLEHTDQITGANRAKIENGRGDILLSQRLATIMTDVPVEFSAEDCLVKEPDIEALIKIYSELEFSSFISKLTQKVQKAAPSSEMGDLFSSAEEQQAATPKISFEIIPSQEAHFEADKPLSILAVVDEKATFLTPRITSLALCQEHGRVVVAKNEEEVRTVLSLITNILVNPQALIITSQTKELVEELAAYGITPKAQFFDITIAHYLLQSEQSHALPILARTYLNYSPAYESDKDNSAESLCERALFCFMLKEVLEKELHDGQLDYLFYQVEMPLAAILAKMELTGVVIDEFALAQSSTLMNSLMRSIEASICSLTNSSININSPRQVGELLFETLKIADKPKKTKTGQYVTDEATLLSYKAAHPVVDQILKYREIKKLVSTYIDALPPLINPISGRVHTAFNQTVTATGRLSSSNPNLQNIPIREQNGKQIRQAFIAPEGYSFLSADYSQIELRLMAHLSKDEQMVRAFLSDEDIHAATAAKVYHTDIEGVTADMRRHAKTANFGIIYGISAFGLSERLGISRQESKALIDGYFESFPAVKSFIDSTVAQAHERGYVETLLHRRRYLPDINSRNNNTRSYAERNAVNAPIQGTAADIIKIAMVRVAQALEQKGLRAQMILQVHDELNFLVPNDEVETTKQVIINAMESAFELAVPLKVDVGVGLNWLEAH